MTTQQKQALVQQPPTQLLDGTPPDGTPPDGADLTARTVVGGAWRAMSVFGGALLQFVVTIFLARVLVPSDFGTVFSAM